MKVTINKNRAVGSVTLPPSKSIAHRYLICSSITDGKTEIRNLPKCDDISATVGCLTALGVRIELSGDSATVYGGFASEKSDRRRLDCRESGSTLRFLMPLALTDGVKTDFICGSSLLRRPVSFYKDICLSNGLAFENTEDGYSVCGKLRDKVFSIPGNITSQYISGLLFALARIGGGKIVIVGNFESRPYVDMTVSVLRTFGFDIRVGEREITVNSAVRTKNTDNLTVPGDESGASLFGALNFLGGDVILGGLEDYPVQGDRVWRELEEKLHKGFCEISLSDCPDLAPILFVLASLRHGAKFTGTGRLRLKESDRISSMAEELAKCGVRLIADGDSVTVPQGAVKPNEALSSHSDHRIAMALAILLTEFGGELECAECVSKSMPEFWSLLKSLGIQISESGGNNK